MLFEWFRPSRRVGRRTKKYERAVHERHECGSMERTVERKGKRGLQFTRWKVGTTSQLSPGIRLACLLLPAVTGLGIRHRYGTRVHTTKATSSQFSTLSHAHTRLLWEDWLLTLLVHSAAGAWDRGHWAKLNRQRESSWNCTSATKPTTNRLGKSVKFLLSGHAQT